MFRFANRVPLLYQAGGCAITKAVAATSWRSYDVQQPKGSVPVGPLAILVHVASVWVPFTSESKEAIASYDEIVREIRLGLMECGRRVGAHIRHQRRLLDAQKKTDYITKYLPAIAEALRDLLELDAKEQGRWRRSSRTSSATAGGSDGCAPEAVRPSPRSPARPPARRGSRRQAGAARGPRESASRAPPLRGRADHDDQVVEVLVAEANRIHADLLQEKRPEIQSPQRSLSNVSLTKERRLLRDREEAPGPHPLREHRPHLRPDHEVHGPVQGDGD